VTAIERMAGAEVGRPARAAAGKTGAGSN
jgi:hypothetical protein